ncbi:uncharacterized protein [Zea mays]|uniref:uncharacterized protein n=1 Tax=Zea mays TaxID=4577 RepID=UPI0004DEB745|nr:uncharacterized protein LOC103640418 [Zea mays]|eukprot:XP_008661226.1 uncharacterized protein LOC103640418 [Zea mays]
MDPDFELEFEMVGVLRAYKTTWDDGDSAAAAAATDVDLLKRAWLNEKAASDILNFDSPLALRVREQIQHLEEALDDFVDDGVDDLVVSLYQMDLDRTLFLLRSYLLLEKIKKYTMHISRSDDLLSHLSQQERLSQNCLYISRHTEIQYLPLGTGLKSGSSWMVVTNGMTKSLASSSRVDDVEGDKPVAECHESSYCR